MAMLPIFYEGNEDDEEDTYYEVDIDSFNLEEYVDKYSGLTRINRIMFIAQHFPKICGDALRLALSYVLKTLNTELFKLVHYKLQNNFKIRQSDVHEHEFKHRLEIMSKKAACRYEHLDKKLRKSFTCSTRHNIYKNFMYIGDHFVERGDFTKATTCYVKAKDYVDQFSQFVSWHIKIIKVKIYLQDWSAVVRSIKNESVFEDREKDSHLDISYCSTLACIRGLTDLKNRCYKSAADNFLEVNFYHYDDDFEVLTKNNVAIYCGLCALASFNRLELKDKIIDNKSFKPFFGLEPKIFDAIFQLHNIKYNAYLKTLDDIKPLLLLDMYIGSHIKTIYSAIGHNTMLEYLRPLDYVDIRKMAVCLNIPLPDLESKLVQLVQDGHINGSFDLLNKALSITYPNRSPEIYNKAMVKAKEINRYYHTNIIRRQVIHSKKNTKEIEKLRMS
ncbi:COP9 signalosome complex subunit 1-like isoform X1 [Adelges cooleyi]|uniref:COP9 signalosome complex subunit 1-like isoform X1 n=1 Tax=Adelges cooleyi TaxID=133065 RepID=UPI00217FAE63|nr:COP9 signalosome complex subunit 1-like isoform X1 [Adelges cooleyi]XP_050438751.1 COP9 signalosome complex subunit 1-like isoform X1 [Adelges cooleyi]XP_050438752.1 COP9 signalosome complex subunit 1-like isoform X1 [Adelges cooleyi]XP_050438753.1 COP9 signalosome complex subunit 1-like isoform X1 [Adelges cooleyi]